MATRKALFLACGIAAMVAPGIAWAGDEEHAAKPGKHVEIVPYIEADQVVSAEI